MFRTLFIAFFMATSVVLYMGGGENTVSNQIAAPLIISHNATLVEVPTPAKVRTVSKRFEKVNVGRRFTDKADIAEELERKHRNKLATTNNAAIYPVAMVQAPQKQALTSQNKYRIAIKMKSELKRVGCFRGAISGSWDANIYKALSHFNASTGQNLDRTKPSLTSLTALKEHYTLACRSKYQVAQRQLHITVAHLPIKKPVSLMQAQILGAPALSNASTKQAALVAPVKKVPFVGGFVRKAKAKKNKVRRIASFEEKFEAAQHQSYYGYNAQRRPPASYVGRRIRKSPKASRKSRRARSRSARRHRAKRKRARKHRRRSRRYRRRRFGFSHNGELGYW